MHMVRTIYRYEIAAPYRNRTHDLYIGNERCYQGQQQNEQQQLIIKSIFVSSLCQVTLTSIVC